MPSTSLTTKVRSGGNKLTKISQNTAADYKFIATTEKVVCICLYIYLYLRAKYILTRRRIIFCYKTFQWPVCVMGINQELLSRNVIVSK